jgi:ABC-type bacteriocin/lantibiotic exporter with double-glycine peptidase domain
MVLSSFGLEISETELRDRCDCNPFGTDALKAVDMARELGFPNTVKCNLRWNELISQIDEDCYPIAFINLFPLDGIKSRHAVVVTMISATHAIVYDPLQGERMLLNSTFESAWAMMNHLVILVRR